MKKLHTYYRSPLPTGTALAAFALAATVLFTSRINAAISLGPTGAGPLTFNSPTPVPADISTGIIIGSGTLISDTASMDAAVAGVTAAGVVTALPTTTSFNPVTLSALGFRHNINAAAFFIQSGPTTGTAPNQCAATVMLATLQNNSGVNQPTLVVGYDFGLFLPLAGEDIGFHVYYSFTGEAGSWQPIPGLTGSETIGNHNATLNLGSWPNGSLLYLLWADDNANGIADPVYTIDNLLLQFAIEPPVITQQPVSSTNLQGRAVSLSVGATGIGLQYQWHKVGVGPIDPGVNPSAATATFSIANAAPSDTGDYFVVIANGGPGVMSQNAHIEVRIDNFAPVFLSALTIPSNLREFRLILDEPLCSIQLDEGCDVDPTDAFSWTIADVNDLTVSLGLESVVLVDRTNLVFRAAEGQERIPGVSYRITLVSEQVKDLFNNSVPAGTFIDTVPSISLKQGVLGYAGTQDTELRGAAPAVAQGSAVSAIVDTADGGGISQALIRFDSLFGSGAGQVPLGASIISATLTLHSTAANADGSPVNVHRMLMGWEQATATYESFAGGVDANGVEAATAVEAVIITQPGPTANFDEEIDVTASVQAWADGAPNYGWALIPTNTDGYRWDTSESTTPPGLVVNYRLLPCAAISITQQPTAPVGGVPEGGSFSLSVGVSSPGCLPEIQWIKDGVDIPGETGLSLSVQNSAPGTSVYRVRVSNSFPSTATSDPVSVTVIPDTIRPHVTRVVSSNSTTLSVTFSEIVSTASAQSLANYAILGTPAATVTSAVLAANGSNVTLTTSPRAFPGAYTLRIQGVTDNRAAANLLNPDPTLVALSSVSVVHAWNSEFQYSTNSQDASLAGTPWYSPAFAPGAEWLTGSGLFGFDDTAATLALLPAPIVTSLTPNNTADTELFVTTYFRRTISLPNLPAGAVYVMCVVIDDGAIIYLDGQPILTNNMPAGLPMFTTRATAASTEGLVQAFPLNVSSGNHTLAVEVHQTGTTTTDVVFGMEIRMVATGSSSLGISSAASLNTLSWMADSSWELMSSPNVAGPYAAQAGVAPFSFPVPVGATNHFYQLRYTGRP